MLEIDLCRDEGYEACNCARHQSAAAERSALSICVPIRCSMTSAFWNRGRTRSIIRCRRDFSSDSREG